MKCFKDICTYSKSPQAVTHAMTNNGFDQSEFPTISSHFFSIEIFSDKQQLYERRNDLEI